MKLVVHFTVISQQPPSDSNFTERRYKTINSISTLYCEAMSKFRSLVLLTLISFAGLLWAVFLSWMAGYFLEGAMMAGLIGITNIIVIILQIRR